MADHDELVTAILASSRALVAIAAISLEAAPVTVTLNQYRALVVLTTRGSLQMSKLAEIMRLSPSSTTRLTERLEAKDLVERRPSPASRRSTELHLTGAGRDLVAAVMAERRRELEEVLAQVPASRRGAIRSAFEAFASAAGEPLDTFGSGATAH